jgi:5-deoxy-glucuronate isomerase
MHNDAGHEEEPTMPPQLHFPCRDSDERVTEIVGPDNAPLRLLRARQLRLTAQQPEWDFETEDCEAVLDIFGGLCTVNISAAAGGATFPEIGARQNVFAGRPTMVYIPKGARVSLFAESETFEGVLITAPARSAYPPALVYPEEAQVRMVGKDNWQRTVITSIGENVHADRLLVGETFNPPGNWSSAPPHKHDRNTESEAPLEEVYLYKLNPAQGFGLQRVYTAPDDPDPFDQTYAVRDGDAVALPRGYHPVVAAPGYQLFYLWALAGDERRYGAWSDDPDHAWIKGIE